MNLQNSKLKNFTPLPNEIFSLHLTTGELAVYALLLRLENRETHECWPSYETIGKSIGKSKSSVKRYVAGLVEKGLITVEPTSVIMQNGLKKNGNLRYHIRPIREAVEWYIQHHLYLAEAAAEANRYSKNWRNRLNNPHVCPCEPLCGLLRGGAVSLPRRELSSRFLADFRGLPRLCGGRKEKQDKRLASLPPLCPDTSARSADSLRRFSAESEMASVGQGFRRTGVIVLATADLTGLSTCLTTIWRNYE